ILRENPDIECYLLNTGSIGKGGKKLGEKISIKISTDLMKHIAKGNIRWAIDPDWHYQVPVEMPEIDITGYNPINYFDETDYQNRVAKLRAERLCWLNKYKGLKKEIVDAIK
ncbi:MAG: phosphoenolpyruvate carboxykinase (ATP), partial [Desulfotomaculaceae bacterium]|nr:phosphoenolpyruvate carboxykinase (ATP) [Desulfotomaculaceae bacterium]